MMIKKIRRKLHELRTYIDYYLKYNKTTGIKVMVFAQGRTGSTLLESLISSSGSLSSKGELLCVSNGEVAYPTKYIKGYSTRFEKFIFHCKIYHLTIDRKRPIHVKEFLNSLVKDGWKIIYLHRENKVNHVLSGVVAKERGGYHKFSGSEEKLEFTLDIGAFEKEVYERLMFDAEEKFNLLDIPHYKVIYERDLEDNQKHAKIAEELCDFIGLSYCSPKTTLKKISNKNWREVIINYDSLKWVARENGWQHFL